MREGSGKNTRDTRLFRLQYRLKEAKIKIKQWAATKGNSAKLVQETRKIGHCHYGPRKRPKLSPTTNQKCGTEEGPKKPTL